MIVAAGVLLAPVGQQPVVGVPRRLGALQVSADAHHVEIVWSVLGNDQQRVLARLRFAWLDMSADCGSGGRRRREFQEIASLHRRDTPSWPRHAHTNRHPTRRRTIIGGGPRRVVYSGRQNAPPSWVFARAGPPATHLWCPPYSGPCSSALPVL